MIESLFTLENIGSSVAIHHAAIHLKTRECLQLIDLTDRVAELVETSGIRSGIVNIQTRHTTTAVIINENEPLLLNDMKATLERLAPQDIDYSHNDFTIRTDNLLDDERENGHSHCKAMFLRTSETLNITDGEIQLGKWQRVFLIELDGARSRSVSLTVIGERN
jgi:secondary thiamine-phosphate synthase enzyme